MQRSETKLLFSASDVVNYLDCEHIITLDLMDLNTPMPKAVGDEQDELVRKKGQLHEDSYLAQLKARGFAIADISLVRGSIGDKAAATQEAMFQGSDIIYQACLQDGPLIGYADFLRKVHTPSALGTYGYEAEDTKLARNIKAKFIVQLAYYSHLVGKAQGSPPQLMHLITGDMELQSFRYADYALYFHELKERFLHRVTNAPVETYPEPTPRCELCKWKDRCEEQRLSDDHLYQVAGMTRLQTKKLEAAGIKTMAALAAFPGDTVVPRLDPATLNRLRHQAMLQDNARVTGKNHYELLPPDPEKKRGFARMPKPDSGDIFFDMEGDPFEEGRLEYLFGVFYFDNGKPQFKPFWAHSRAEEKKAFEQYIDFVTDRLARFPQAHIYHYASYEKTALTRLMSLHGTREAEVDNLLRTQKLMDLYRVVAEGIRVSEPGYSIKNIEHFYLEKRKGEVKTAGASIVFYERWKETGDSQLLKDIEAYNRDDVVSTYELLKWLLSLRPAGIPWANDYSDRAMGENQPEAGEMTDAEKRLIPYRQKLIDSLPPARDTWGPEEHIKELTFQLLDFHRRQAKPQWWAMFSRQEMADSELIEDVECLGGLTLDPASPPAPDKRSVIYTYHYPEQETKIKAGDTCVHIATLAPLNDMQIDEEAGLVRFRYAAKREPLPPNISIGPAGPISTDVLKEAVFRFADSIIAGNSRYLAIKAILGQAIPRIRNLPQGRSIIDDHQSGLSPIINAVANLDDSYVFIQGPPGTGKTYTGSHVIVELLRRGKRVGISSNSHKAINNLLSKVEKVALEDKLTFRGVKKSSPNNQETEFDGQLIDNVAKKDEVIGGNYQLIAGTAWLFADPAFDQILDYLFVDEAGQVAIANLIAMGTSARNIVLLGDQMQLGQPIQGVHPGRSGESTLDFLLNGEATIPSERGIFLKTTWRMHPDVCRFISDAVYDGRLESRAENINQRLVLGSDAHPTLRPSGIRYVPIEHDACTQQSREEAEQVLVLYLNLLKQRYTDKDGRGHSMSADNILVVAPYNMQVNLLKETLPAGARVGTVDKFQGQEAEVVIISMTTSNGDYLPRDIEFLYSKNRLNVAISRAKCLAILVANPALTTIRCSTPEQMALVNTLCWIKDCSVLNETLMRGSDSK